MQADFHQILGRCPIAPGKSSHIELGDSQSPEEMPRVHGLGSAL